MKMTNWIIFGAVLFLPSISYGQMNKHDQSVAQHGYTIPIVTYQASQSASTSSLSDDIDQGNMVVPRNEENIPQLVPIIHHQDRPHSLKEPKEEMKELPKFNQSEFEYSLQKLADSALKKGGKAKDFTLMSANGSPVTLYEELMKGPVVLIWYRGGWCPYCNIQLRSFQDQIGEINAAGAQLMAISPEMPDHSLTTAQKNSLKYHVLSDTNNNVARAYGLVYPAPPSLKEKLPDLDLKKHNGAKTNELPLTATYVIDKDGTITYALIIPDYKERAQPSDVLAVLNTMNSLDPAQKIESIIESKDQESDMELKPMVEMPAENMEAETTLEVRAKEEGLVPKSY